MKTVKFKFHNGQEVRDKVSKVTGIINGCAYWLNGCKRYSVQPPVEKGKNDKPDSWWMDEEQLELISQGVCEDVIPSNTGGPSFRSNDR